MAKGQRLFSIGKVPVLLTGWSGGIEKRKDDPQTKVVVLSCSVAPFTSKHATAIENGVQGEKNLRSVIFDQTGDAKPRAGFNGYDFSISIPRKDFEMFATPDSPGAAIVLDHVKIREAFILKAHSDNPNAMVLTFKAVVGPCSSKELAEIQKWFKMQRFISFTESDPSMEFEEIGEGEEEEEDEPDDAQGKLPTPEFDTDKDGAEVEEGGTVVEQAHRQLHSHQSGTKKTRRPTTH